RLTAGGSRVLGVGRSTLALPCGSDSAIARLAFSMARFLADGSIGCQMGRARLAVPGGRSSLAPVRMKRARLPSPRARLRDYPGRFLELAGPIGVGLGMALGCFLGFG